LLLLGRLVDWTSSGIWIDPNVDSDLEMILFLVDKTVVSWTVIESLVRNNNN
jgi:hypothetical protein